MGMMVCINPRSADFDENLNVMEFAETAQKIQIERVEPVARELYTPGRMRGNEAYRDALRRVNNADTPAPPTGLPSSSVYKPIYNLGPECPSFDINQNDFEEYLESTENWLTKRIATRNTLVENYNGQMEKLRALLVEQEKELIVLREENTRLKGGSDGERRRIKDLESRLVNAEAANNSLQMKNVFHQERLRAVRKIVGEDTRSRLMNKTVSDPDMSTIERENQFKRKPLSTARSNNDVSSTPTPTPRRSVAVANPRYRRSRSAGQVWHDQQPTKPVPTNTIMQPSNLQKRRSKTKVSEKDPLKCSNYAVTTQEQDSDGDIETKIFKD